MDMGDMYHHVPDYYRSVSERVSNILDVIGYSQEDRDRKVLAATGHDVFINIVNCFRLKNQSYQYIFGSRGEGSTGPGLNSDQDILFCGDKVQMVSDLSDCQPDKINFLMVYDDHTHPGYVKLQYLPDNTPEPVFLREAENLTVDSNDRVVLPHQFGREIAPNEVFTGPAMRTLNDTKEACTDNVYAIRCARWPNQANEWFQRRRPQGWPDSHHLRNARKDGCFAIAVGHPYSHESDLEWRLSFSFIERELIRSFEDTVMKEEVDYLMDLASMCLSLGINSDATSVRLKLCGLGTMLGNFDLTEICLQHMSDYRMRYMASSKIHTFYALKCNLEFTLEKCSRKKCCQEDLQQNQLSFSVVYLPSETHITPIPLKMEMFRSFGERADLRDTNKPLCYELVELDSLMCLYFFQYLNFSRLGKERHQQAALDNMIFLMRTESEMPHRETELNLIGYCFMREYQYINSFICFNKSLKLCPHHNTAKFYLGILFHKIHIARSRRYIN
ncbi:hypothetical protein CHS0354_011199 [Potamilus streckersoni]|uniref:Mab-21-like nucleotidyltransferase domain-containing protein n=1 Tax=Potamilus streckersoni TaxID=2493646 RepID=A0AAE0T330_9BIVA|nr:hypothetical protein CHS0354_011199 [Potamilus streckersoni]